MDISKFNVDLVKPILDYELLKIPEQDREDLRQSSVLRILKALVKYSDTQLPQNKLKAFSRVIIKREVADYFRRYYKLRNLEDINSEDVQESNIACIWEDPPIDIKVDYYNNRKVFSVSEQKVLDYMLSISGIKAYQSDIAKIVGVHKSTVTRALQKLYRLSCVERGDSV